MKKKLRVGVLFGGRSGEHEVSLVSAASVIRGLDPEKYQVIPIGISKSGRWLLPRTLTQALAERPSASLSHTDLRRALADGQVVALPPEPDRAMLVAEGANPEASAPPPGLDVI
ncbi:MAG: D-alanine--D-alanine ligase A, partial [Terriglobia bacterium]